MDKKMEIQLKEKAEALVKKGHPLIPKAGVVNPQNLQKEGTILHLIDRHGKFYGKGYYGQQNKGVGWVLTRQEEEQIDQRFFEKRIAAALQKRAHYFELTDTNAFRVFNGEGDGIGGLIIDYYDGYYVVSWYSEGIYTFHRQVYDALDHITEYKAIYEKKRFDTSGQYIEQDDFVCGTRGEFPIIIQENGMNFAVDLNDGAMTGIFLDQRDVRKVIRDRYAKDKTVLNTFSYTGAFSVAAALGGATKTVSVDLASRSEAKTIEQFSVNGIDYEQQEIRVFDVFNYFRYAKRHALKFDLVIIDPPSFARSKKYTFSTAKDYPDLMKSAIDITEKNGVIVASTNNASFGMKKFKGFIDKAFKERNIPYQILEEYGLPNDFRTIRQFPEMNYLKVVILQKKK